MCIWYKTLKRFTRLNFYFFLFFRETLCSQKTCIEGTEIPIFTLPQAFTAPPIINIFHQSNTFVTIAEPTLTHHYHQKFIIYNRVPFWSCESIGLDKCIVTYPPLQYHAKKFHSPKNYLCSTYSSLPLS